MRVVEREKSSTRRGTERTVFSSSSSSVPSCSGSWGALPAYVSAYFFLPSGEKPNESFPCGRARGASASEGGEEGCEARGQLGRPS